MSNHHVRMHKSKIYLPSLEKSPLKNTSSFLESGFTFQIF